MADRIASIWPEIIVFITVCVVMVMGLSRDRDVRRSTTWVAGFGLFLAFIAARVTPPVQATLLPELAGFFKPAVCLIGLLLLPLVAGSIDHAVEKRFDAGMPYEPRATVRGEFLCMFLLSLAGVMLCTSAGDLIWLFLALELTSLPTYVMVATSRTKTSALESAVKYFFLGAVAAAIFLYGFVLLYGATGTLHLVEIRAVLAQQAASPAGLSPMAILGLILAFVGVSFKIAAVPMHFYVADVYEGSAAPVSAFLAFVPKTAGFVVILMLMSTVSGAGPDGSLPPAIHATIWLIAVATMTIGNCLALLQRNIKRVLAYSSIAHSGYMLIGVLAGSTSGLATNGYAAVAFYLVAYGVMNMGTFAVVACLQRRGEEIQTLDDLAGLSRRHPVLASVMAICALSLLGFPPLLGFFGKIYLFSAGIAAGEIVLVIIAGLNSAVSAWYYLKLAGIPWLTDPTRESETILPTPFVGRRITAVLCGVAVIVLVFAASPLMTAGHAATSPSKLSTAADLNLSPSRLESSVDAGNDGESRAEHNVREHQAP